MNKGKPIYGINDYVSYIFIVIISYTVNFVLTWTVEIAFNSNDLYWTNYLTTIILRHGDLTV